MFRFVQVNVMHHGVEKINIFVSAKQGKGVSTNEFDAKLHEFNVIPLGTDLKVKGRRALSSYRSAPKLCILIDTSMPMGMAPGPHNSAPDSLMMTLFSFVSLAMPKKFYR